MTQGRCLPAVFRVLARAFHLATRIALGQQPTRAIVLQLAEKGFAHSVLDARARATTHMLREARTLCSTNKVLQCIPMHHVRRGGGAEESTFLQLGQDLRGARPLGVTDLGVSSCHLPPHACKTAVRYTAQCCSKIHCTMLDGCTLERATAGARGIARPANTKQRTAGASCFACPRRTLGLDSTCLCISPAARSSTSLFTPCARIPSRPQLGITISPWGFCAVPPSNSNVTMRLCARAHTHKKA